MEAQHRKSTRAGFLYPADAEALSDLIQNLLDQHALPSSFAKILIVPHASYQYIGSMLAQAYAHLHFRHHQIKKVVLLGTSHHINFNGIAITSKSHYLTPLGKVPITEYEMIHLLRYPQIIMFDEVHTKEHSLGLHLPFLQNILQEFSIIPLIVGENDMNSLMEVLNKIWGNDDTIIIASLNLSRYQSYQSALETDRQISQAIEKLDWHLLPPNQTCNAMLMGSLLKIARQKLLTPKKLNVLNSGDITGMKDRVFGYGTFIFE